MTISWHGFNYFKLKNSSHSLIFNPYSLDKTTKFSKANADLILFSNPDQMATANFNEKTFVIDSPGEYEANDIFVYGKMVKGNIVYYVVFEDIKIAFLGEFGHTDLSSGTLELIEGADILILPVGGGDLSTAKEASRLINQIEPRLIIPSCHGAGSFKLKTEPVDSFIKEFGGKSSKEDVLRIKKKDLPQDDVQLIILNLQK